MQAQLGAGVVMVEVPLRAHRLLEKGMELLLWLLTAGGEHVERVGHRRKPRPTTN